MIVNCVICKKEFEQTKRIFKFIHEDVVYKICPNCLNYARLYNRNTKEQRKKCNQIKYEERSNSGICVFCGNKIDNGLVYCSSCKEKIDKRKPLVITEERLFNLKSGEKLFWKFNRSSIILENSYGVSLSTCPIVQSISKVDNIIYITCDNLNFYVDMNHGHMNGKYKIHTLHIVKGEMNETSH